MTTSWAEPRRIDTDYVMSNNFAFGGINTSLVFGRWKGNKTMLRRRKTNHPSILEALYEAQKIAFSPFIFEACVAAKRMGLLAAIDKAQGGEKSL